MATVTTLNTWPDPANWQPRYGPNEDDLDLPQLPEKLRDELNDAWRKGDLGNDPLVAQEVAMAAWLMCERDSLRQIGHAVHERNLALEQVERWRALAEETQEQHRQRTKAAPKKSGKRVNTVKFDVHATFTGPAELVVPVLRERYGSNAGKTFMITHARWEGPDIWMSITYGPVKGGEKADVRRVLERCANQAGVQLAREPEIDVLERVRHE